MYRAKQLWECGENIYLAGLNEDGTHHQIKYLRREEYLPVGSIVHMEGREFRVDKVDFDKDSVALQDMALADLRMPIFREVPLAIVRELYEQEPEPPVLVSDGLGLPGEDSNKLPVSIEVNGVPTPPEAAAAEEGRNEEGAPEPAGNFRITDEELGAGGPKQKFARNIKAIKTLFTLEQEHRGATAEEQQVLSQYVGWGGLADAFDPDKSSWAKEYGTLQKKNLTHFDCWASTFGETTTAIELAPEGTGYRARTRFAKFFNLPELMAMFKEVTDIKTRDQLHLPVPEAKFETVVVKPSEIQKEMVQNLSERAAKVHSGTVDASEDNMLCITNDGRKIGLDQRLMNPLLPDDPASKLNACVRNVLQIWEDGREQKLTQLLFCDLSTPKNDGQFNVYDDIKTKLLAAGVPENEIEFIHNADTEAKKAVLFSKVRSGDVRVLLGSTAKMGAGTNVQSRLVAVHHLDVGWKPSDMTQRNGRIIRQGNRNKEVKVFNYVTEGTFDAYLWQTLENKQRFISQIMTSKSPVRSYDDVDEQALSYAEVKALCAGNPLIKEKMDLDVQVAKLKVLKADHQSQKFRLQDKLLTKFPADIQETNAHIAGLKADAQLAAAHPQGKEEFCGMTIKGVAYDEKKAAGERLVLACSELPNAEEKVIGSYRGFELSLRFDAFRSEYQAILKGQRKYTVPLGTDPLGNIIRLDNSLNNFPERINSAENELATLHQQQAAAQIEVEKPFPQEEELAEKSARLAELNAQLDVDEKNHEPEQDEEEPEEAPRRPSVLAALEEKSDKPEPVKPFRSYYDKDGDAR